MAARRWPPRPWTSSSTVPLVASLGIIAVIYLAGTMSSWAYPAAALAALSYIRPAPVAAQDVDVQWYPSSQTRVNDLAGVLEGTGVWDFVFNSSVTPDERYGVYNWCNMPHVRSSEYVKARDGFTLQYVEVIQRHHKRTVYHSNSFPVESYTWDCDDQGLYGYGEPFAGNRSARAYREGFVSPVNPFQPSGFRGSCQFPQITEEGLDDSWQHGADLYGVYHDLLGFLPGRDGEYRDKVKYRVSNNLITSQVAGMLINGMWDTTEPFPVMSEQEGIDFLAPQYSCPRSSSLFNSIRSSSNPSWRNRTALTGSLFSTLDALSGVPPNDGGWHDTFDHYYDNLSARQCHAKPLPCRLVGGQNSTDCFTQDLADRVYRLGNWEYSQIYRGTPESLAASASSYGVWVAHLAEHLREVVAGTGETLYFHNVAHDGSMSRLMSVLQIDEMVWPGMGAEIVFELYKQDDEDSVPTPQPTPTGIVAPGCSRNNCLRQVIRQSASASSFCPGFTTSASTAVPTWAANCADAAQLSSACGCVVQPTATATTPAPSQTAAPSESGFYVRVLWNGQVFRSASPTLGLMDMVPVETLLAYFDGLVGRRASLVRANCA
ncbi:hypothetical protein S40288_02641 [Stachybotrys chartarum IBT 40288]|nr:hypothetical protein S40288_02641 [Stachybotrys chartarum IBT 40288]